MSITSSLRSTAINTHHWLLLLLILSTPRFSYPRCCSRVVRFSNFISLNSFHSFILALRLCHSFSFSISHLCVWCRGRRTRPGQLRPNSGRSYIFDYAEVDIVVADAQFASLLTEGNDCFVSRHPNVPILIDADIDTTEGELRGAFDVAVLGGLRFETHRPDAQNRDWAGLYAFAAAQQATSHWTEMTRLPFHLHQVPPPSPRVSRSHL